MTTSTVETIIPPLVRKEREKVKVTLKTTQTYGNELKSITKEIELVNFNRIGIPLSIENYKAINFWFGQEWSCTRCQINVTWASSICKRQCTYHEDSKCCGGIGRRSEVKGCIPCDHSRNSRNVKPTVPICDWIFLNIFKTREEQKFIKENYQKEEKRVNFNGETYVDLWKSYRILKLFN